MSEIQSTNEIKSYWNSFKDTYLSRFEEITTVIYNSLVPLCKLSSATKIIETGCGAGNGLQILRSKISETIEIMANDLSEAMIEASRSKQLGNIQLIIANNEELPYPNSFADRYIANMSLHLVEHPQTMINEAFRVLQPGGIAVFSVANKPKPNNFLYIAESSCEKSGISSKNRPFYHLGDSQGLRKMLEESGFTKVLSFSSSIGIGTFDVEAVLNFAIILPMLVELKKNSEETYETVLQDIKDSAQAILDSGSAIVFDSLIVAGIKSY